MADNLPTQSATPSTVATGSVIATAYKDVSGTQVHLQRVEASYDAARLQVAAAGLTNTTYATGDMLGTGFTFANAVLVSGGCGAIVAATLLDKKGVLGATDLVLFNDTVTPAADNAAAVFSEADLLKCVGVLQFAAPILVDTDSKIAVASTPLPLLFQCAATSLIGHLITRTANGAISAADAIAISLTIRRV